MTRNTLTNWWGVITAVLGGLVLIPALALLGTGIDDGDNLLIAIAVGGVVAGALLLGGLATKARHPRVGSWMIVVGAVIMLLIWTYLSSIIVLLGCEFNAARERRLGTLALRRSELPASELTMPR